MFVFAGSAHSRLRGHVMAGLSGCVLNEYKGVVECIQTDMKRLFYHKTKTVHIHVQRKRRGAGPPGSSYSGIQEAGSHNAKLLSRLA